MSVPLTTQFFRRPFRAYDDPSLPEGYWTAGTAVVGDNTGGSRSISIAFQTSNQGRSGNMFSLEQLSVSDANNVAKDFAMQANGLDTIGNQAGIHDIVGSLSAGVATAGIAATTYLALRRLFLGAPFSSVGAFLIFVVDNVDGASFEIAAQGYIWGPRSIMAKGGPQRPANGIYSN